MASSSNSSSRTLSENTRDRDEVYDSLAPLTNVSLPRYSPWGVDLLSGGFDLMGFGGVDSLDVKEVVGVDSLSSSPLVPSSHLS